MLARIEVDGKELTIVRVTFTKIDPTKPSHERYNERVSPESVEMLDAMCAGLTAATGKVHKWVWYF